MQQKGKVAQSKEIHIEVEESIQQKEEFFAGVVPIFKNYPTLSDDQLNFVCGIMQQVEFFKKSCPEACSLEDFTKICCSNLQYQFLPKDSPAFHIDDQGDKFYIVLSGKVGIYIKRPLQQVDADEEAMLSKIQKIRERAITDQGTQQIDKVKIFEKVIRRQSKASKVIDSETVLLRCGRLGTYFTDNGICKVQLVGQLNSGQSFGEMALTTDKLRSASVIALNDVQLLSLSKENYKKIFEREIRNQQQKIEYFLRMFPAMTKFNMSKLIQYFTPLTLPINFCVWKQGDFADTYFLLKEGEVQLEICLQESFMSPKTNKDSKDPHVRKDDKKETIILANLTDGCFVGDTDIFNNSDKRQFTAKTMKQCQIYQMTFDGYLIAKKTFPEFYQAMMSLQEKTLHFFQKRVSDILVTKRNNFYLTKKEELQYVERRYANEFEIKEVNTSPIIRSNIQTKLTKLQVIQSNQSILEQCTKLDEARGVNKEFNMLKMAGENFQKCLLIRVEKQFEKHQPSKPKGPTPYFSKNNKDIKTLIEQIKRQQLPSLNSRDSLSHRNQNDDQDGYRVKKFLKAKSFIRIINPAVQQKTELIKQQLFRKSMSSFQKTAFRRETHDEQQQVFVLTDTINPYQPLHSKHNQSWRKMNKTQGRQTIDNYENTIVGVFNKQAEI